MQRPESAPHFFFSNVREAKKKIPVLFVTGYFGACLSGWERLMRVSTEEERSGTQL